MRRRFSALALVGSFALFQGGRATDAADPADARVIAAWAAGPFEARIAFDRPIATDVAGSLVGRSIAYDESRPTVHSKPSTALEGPDARGSLRIVAARTVDDGRTLVLTTDPHPRAATYSLDLPIGGPGKSVAVVYDLSGVEVSWSEEGKEATPPWSGWWPTLDPARVAKELGGSAEHARGLATLGRKGKLSLYTLLVLPKGPVVLTVSASAPIEPTLNGEAPESSKGGAVFRSESASDPLLLGVILDTGKTNAPMTLRVAARGTIGAESSLTAGQLMLPWAPAAPPIPSPLENVPELAGGDPIKGKAVFMSADAKCASCHKVRGEGGNVGPDLSDFVGRDPKGVYRDIAEPSAKIHPDYVPYTVALKDGRVLVGTVKAEGAGAIRVADTEAKVTVVPRVDIDAFRPSATSVMPVGLAGALGEEKIRDLIAFLTAAPTK